MLHPAKAVNAPLLREPHLCRLKRPHLLRCDPRAASSEKNRQLEQRPEAFGQCPRIEAHPKAVVIQLFCVRVQNPNIAIFVFLHVAFFRSC